MAFRDYILRGIQQGFRIGFDRSSKLGSRPLNLPSEEKNGGGGDGYIEEEWAQGHLLELTASLAESVGVHCSPFGVISKKNRPDKWRLILDLSSPKKNSVNDGFAKELTTVSYVSVD